MFPEVAHHVPLDPSKNKYFLDFEVSRDLRGKEFCLIVVSWGVCCRSQRCSFCPWSWHSWATLPWMRAWAVNDQGNLWEIWTCFPLTLETDNARACQGLAKMYQLCNDAIIHFWAHCPLIPFSPGYLLVATTELAVLTLSWCCLIMPQASCFEHTVTCSIDPEILPLQIFYCCIASVCHVWF